MTRRNILCPARLGMVDGDCIYFIIISMIIIVIIIIIVTTTNTTDYHNNKNYNYEHVV